MSTEVRLERMKLTNFKGIRDLEVEFNGKPATVLGANESGKTTLVDAFTWALFGHDSTGSHNFKLKTYDESGQVIHHLDHEVELELTIDGENGQETLVLRRNKTEDWTQGRGDQDQEFRGHSTDYYINGAPYKKSEYEQRINAILDEETFSLITNPTYFAQNLHWEERRKKLLDMVEQPDFEDIVGRKPELEDLSSALGQHDFSKIENFERFLSDRIKEINKKLDKLPDRIDEARRNLPDESWKNLGELKRAKSEMKVMKKELESEIAQAKAGGRKAKIKDQIAEVEAAMNDIEGNYAGANEERKARIQEHIKSLDLDIEDLRRDQERLREDIEQKQERLEEARAKLKELQEDWDSWQEKSFSEDQKTCPTCGQTLPEDKIEQKRKDFNRKKANKMEDLAERGKAKKAQVEDLEKEIADMEAEVEELSHKITEKEEEREKVEEKQQNLPDPTKQAHEDERYQELKDKKQNLESKLENAEEPDLSEEKEKLAFYEEEIEKTEEDIAKLKAGEKAKDRVEELEAQRRELSQQVEHFERLQYLTEEYTRARLEMLQERINQMFEIVNWQLFEEQVNGGIKDVCYPTKDGVPFSALNGAGKIQAGLDIIRTLSEVYQTTAPIWIDQRESVATIPDVDAQVINLYHDPGQENLKIDVAAEQPREKVEHKPDTF